MKRAELIARLQEGASLGAARLKKAAAHPALKRALSVLLRTPPLALDFARPQSRSHGTGLAAVALGAVLLTLALWQSDLARERVARSTKFFHRPTAV